MSETPINVFGRSGDAAGIAQVVADGLEGSTIRPDGRGFVVTAAPKRRVLRAAGREVTVNVRLDYFEGDDGRRQALGMANFVGSNMGGPGVADLLSAIPELRLAVAFMASQPITTDPNDEVFRLAMRVAALADGFVLSLGDGKAWASDGQVLAELVVQPDSSLAPGDQDVEDDFVADPPPADRVIRRLLVLTSVAARALSEADGEDLDAARAGILNWVGGLGVESELEPAEQRLLAAPAGEVPIHDRVAASWRIEGAAVLGCAAGLLEIDGHTVPIDPADLTQALGFPDPDRTASLIAPLSLRSRDELNALADRLFAIHWRLREQSLRPRAFDFEEFARTAWFGPLNIEGVPLIDGDLAVGDRALMDADPSAVATATSVVSERHLAANWLREGGVYSETDTST